ncbi:SEC10/PgrA surface exclusion domain-containing protein [Streptococcus suis]|uniref:LPXTG cell wall anchor domain-containing protein n=1 Tax=Streptococcus suis TaxID=1307 RepID=UPI002AAD51C5|nr:SEC10/PgrA surface exclusion domain-containing protein [Streptococcus suis]HEM6363232.1 SEC10/PgrA surface exclusion domain-containing protein [Streptococcus suis]
MLKSNIHGHGTIKKLRTGAVVSVLTTSMLVGGVVSAEEVVTSAESTSVEVVAESGASEGIVETKVTDAQVSEAKAEADQANQAVTEQEAVVGGLEETIATGESTVSTLTTQIEEANKVTPEVVADAKTDADAKSDALATANETVETAKNSANATAEAVTVQEGVVSDADANAQKTASAVADAEKKVADLSGTTDTTQLQKDVDTLTENVAKDTTDLAEAKQALESAQLAETNKAQAITAQEGVVASKEADVDSTANALANATKAKSDADKEVSTTKSALDTAKAGTTVTETVQVGTKTTGGTSTLNTGVAQSGRFSGVNGVVTNSDYLKAIQNYANGTGTIADIESALAKGISYQSGGSTVSVKVNVRDLLASPTVAEFQSWTENLRYSFSDTDNSTLVKVHDLTEEQRTDLSLFYASLVNELRSKLGTPLLDVTKSSVSVANNTTDALFNGMFANYRGMTHDQLVASGFFTKATGTINDVTVIAKSIANNENTTIINNIANIAQFDDRDATVSTMAELKSMVVAAVGHQLYRPLYNIVNGVGNNSDFSTALKVLGLVEGVSSVGVSLDVLSFKDGHGERVPKVVVTFSDTVGTPIVNKYSTVTGGTTTTTPIYETVTKTVVDESAVAAAQSAYDTALANAQTANVAYQNANTAYVNAQQALADAQKQLSDLKSGTVDIPALEQAVKDAETQLEKDQASLQSAKETLAVAKASAIDKANALSKAKAELVEARSADEKAQGVLAQEKETLEVLKKADQVAQLALTDAIAKQSTAKSDSEKATAKYNELAKALVDKGAVLTVLNVKLTEANQALAVARAEYETAKELLATLKANATEKTARYEELANLKAEQDRAEAEAKRLADLKTKAEAINNAGGIATPVLDANGVVIDYVDGKKATSVVQTKIGKQAGITQVGDKITYSRVERAKTLPNTGEQTSLLALAGVSVLSSLGLASVRRRKQG